MPSWAPLLSVRLNEGERERERDTFRKQTPKLFHFLVIIRLSFIRMTIIPVLNDPLVPVLGLWPEFHDPFYQDKEQN